jgi:hypothetical protein
MRALKALVIIMGVMLLVGFIALIVAIAERVSKKTADRPASPAAGQPLTAAPIELPRGAHIESMAAGTDRIILDLLLPDGGRRLLVIDLATGRNLVTIPLHSVP